MSESREHEEARAFMQKVINANAGEREQLEAIHGQVWDTAELTRDFMVNGFSAPFVVVTRNSDGKRGSLTFQHHPRFYWGFEEG